MFTIFYEGLIDNLRYRPIFDLVKTQNLRKEPFKSSKIQNLVEKCSNMRKYSLRPHFPLIAKASSQARIESFQIL